MANTRRFQLAMAECNLKTKKTTMYVTDFHNYDSALHRYNEEHDKAKQKVYNAAQDRGGVKQWKEQDKERTRFDMFKTLAHGCNISNDDGESGYSICIELMEITEYNN